MKRPNYRTVNTRICFCCDSYQRLTHTCLKHKARSAPNGTCDDFESDQARFFLTEPVAEIDLSKPYPLFPPEFWSKKDGYK